MHPTEKKWEKRCFEVFSQGLEEMHQELSKDGEDHKLGDVKTTPLDLHTLGLHTSNFCFSIQTLYRINLERRFLFLFESWETTTLSIIYERATGNMGWNMLDAFIRLGKGMFDLIFMIHIVAWFMSLFMSNSLQILFGELSLIHVLVLIVILLGLTWIS